MAQPYPVGCRTGTQFSDLSKYTTGAKDFDPRTFPGVEVEVDGGASNSTIETFRAGHLGGAQNHVPESLPHR
jgi:hypothetical protein